MRATLALTALLVVAQGAPLDVDSEWENFKLTFGRNFASQLEHDHRQAIFVDNLKYINQHNAEYELGLHSFTLGVNKYADMTHEEVASKLNNLQISSAEQNYFNEVGGEFDVSALPKSVDWRKKGHVTPAKDQNPCGVCWAFSAVATLESAHFKKTGNLVPLSVENLVECTKLNVDGHLVNHPCLGDNAGDDPVTGINFAIKNGIEAEKSYPYDIERLDSDYKCQFNKSKVAATFTDMVNITSGSEAALQQAVANVGTISVSIDASKFSFAVYESGVYKVPDCGNKWDELNHGIAVVGYGTTENGEDYWIVKNSWGTDWGENGFGKIARNKDNMCGIATHAVYAIA